MSTKRGVTRLLLVAWCVWFLVGFVFAVLQTRKALPGIQAQRQAITAREAYESWCLAHDSWKRGLSDEDRKALDLRAWNKVNWLCSVKTLADTMLIYLVDFSRLSNLEPDRNPGAIVAQVRADVRARFEQARDRVEADFGWTGGTQPYCPTDEPQTRYNVSPLAKIWTIWAVVCLVIPFLLVLSLRWAASGFESKEGDPPA
jgi:hypothetical protein